MLALGNGFFGYSLPDDLLSGAGLRIAYAILLSVPVIGPWLAFLALGGTVPVDATTPHMYGLHIFLIPVLILTLLALHLGIIWRQLHTNYPGRGAPTRPLSVRGFGRPTRPNRWDYFSLSSV